MIGFTASQPLVSLSEAQAYLRVETGDEEALLAGLLRTASGLCESFLNRVVLSRAFVEELSVSREWQRLRSAPVQSITDVSAFRRDGGVSQLSAGEYTVDIDARGDGWVRVTSPMDAARLQVSGVAGMAAGVNDVPEPIRHGVLRLTAHLFANRDGAEGEPPAAVTALWRPYRRVRLG